MTKQNRTWYRKVDVEAIDLGDRRTAPPTMALGKDSSWDEDMDISRGEWLGLVFPGALGTTIEYANKCWKAEVRSRLLKPKKPTVRTPRPPKAAA
jgi:hypothetical protein